MHFRSEEVTIVAQRDDLDGSAKARGQVRSAHLVILSGSNVGQVFKLVAAESVIGREEGVAVQILDAGISRRHAAVSHDGEGSYFLVDAGSRNGTYVNNRRVEQKHPLKDGDKIQIGVSTILKFTHDDAPEASYAEAMYEAALRDGLTGVFNRRYFEERLRSEYAFADRHGTTLALLFLDLDHFKNVNDSLGHLAGDAVLKQFAQLVASSIRTEDVLCRYGGEEFAVLCRETDLMRASVLGERVRHAVSTHAFSFEGKPVQITVSIGIAAVPDETIRSAEGLLAAADGALYQAKERGRNCVVMRPPKE